MSQVLESLATGIVSDQVSNDKDEPMRHLHFDRRRLCCCQQAVHTEIFNLRLAARLLTDLRCFAACLALHVGAAIPRWAFHVALLHLRGGCDRNTALPIFFFGAAVFARKAYAAQKTLQHPITVTWSEEGFRSTAQQGDWNVPWNDYLKWTEDSKVILLYQGPRVFNMLPKRVLTPAQVDDFRQLAAANIKCA
ncbi:YcxB family protein [Agrobacterium pusense]|uniref:YcxB family protein n=1 Tax=Agrobacterium pusense TaxID=648995 RepID=UPI001F33C0B2|nr:YcxB family protein [Agrobacterium pusense]